MRDVVLYIAMSIDGYIARSDGSVDWLNEQGESSDSKSFEEFYKNIDTVTMGRTTYDQIIEELSPDKWPYPDVKSYVVTTRDYKVDKNVEFISDNIIDFIKGLKEGVGKDIWLLGGSNLVNQLIEADLIDKYIITIVPLILGEGIPLFKEKNFEKN